ncbi:MAG: hypothetical protein MJZ13_01950 [Bacteroidales bacterium]|nr:hypothetical protein [Bacteroidales bacterium]
MRYISAAFIAAVLVGCSSGENNSRSLLVDFNGTVESPLYAYASLDSSSPVDTAILVDGQYRFHTDSWSDGFYRIASDPDNSFEIFIGDVDNVLINARRNHLDESTTNSYQTRMLWQVNNLASRMALLADSVMPPSLQDSLFSVFRKQADDIRIHADTAMASLSLLQLSFHGKPLYDMVADHLVFENSIEYLNRKMPSDVAVQQLSAKVDSTREVASFLARYAKGRKAPQFHMTTVNNQRITNDDLVGVPYVFYLTNDTTSSSESKWLQVALNRFNGMKVVAAIPSSLSRIHNLNVLQGSILPSEANALLRHQPLTIFVDEGGLITSMTIDK